MKIKLLQKLEDIISKKKKVLRYFSSFSRDNKPMNMKEKDEIQTKLTLDE